MVMIVSREMIIRFENAKVPGDLVEIRWSRQSLGKHRRDFLDNTYGSVLMHIPSDPAMTLGETPGGNVGIVID
jgi:hypothetical protein